MTININVPELRELHPRILVLGVGGAGGNAINGMIESGLQGVEFVAVNTDAQDLKINKAKAKIQLGANLTRGLGAGARLDVGQAAADESLNEIINFIQGANMVFITAGMGGGTGTGAAHVIARAAKELNILTVGVITLPFLYEGPSRMRRANQGLEECEIGNKKVKISAIAKGSGMIAPNMATMLAFIFTDANIPSAILKTLLLKNVNTTFNAITVDGDTSTNDMVGIFSTGTARNSKIYNVLDPKLKMFEKSLHNLMLNLAKQIVADGEGAKKFVIINVTKARSSQIAKKIAFTVANSPLIKTAIAGEDPNWGRIIMAIGKSGESINADKLKIQFGEFTIIENGQQIENYDEKIIREYMKWESIEINIELNMGEGSFTVYTVDFTKNYIEINADYRN